jgi:outer membrane lipoprotein carrier protein LolA
MKAVRLAGWVFAAFPAVTLTQAAPPDAPVSLDHLMAALHSVRHVDARYVEHRTLHALRTPIEIHGTLRFDAPDRLEKAADPAADGTIERLTIDGNRLTIDRGHGAPPVELLLSEHPEIGVLIESIRATLAGDGSALRRTFDISLAGPLSHWQLVLQPHDPANRTLLQWMRITGYDTRINAIDTQNGDGDHSEMAIVQQNL